MELAMSSAFNHICHTDFSTKPNRFRYNFRCMIMKYGTILYTSQPVKNFKSNYMNSY